MKPASVTLSEAKRLMRGWTRAGSRTLADSIRYHFGVHGAEVGAIDVWQYLRKAHNFKQRLRGAARINLDEGKTRYIKQDRYIILDARGKIVSYGITN